jgi:serine/threonine-protein kinase
MGSVWLAHHATLNAPVALKLIDSAKLGQDAAQRFLAEARMAAALRSPHVVQILDYGVDAGTPHIAMEVLEGETLAQRLSRVQRLSVPETARVVQQVVRAIARAHDAGVVHRDLKPENIFIVQNDDDELIKVLDFGIAKASPGMLGTSVSPETRTGAVLGTPYYMSPEQVDGIESIDFRADLWALGVVAYQCLLGQLPFQGDSVGRLVLAICTRPMPVPSSAGSVPLGFDAWFARACARDVEQRFGSARQAASEFLALSEGAPSSVPAPSAPQPVVPASAAALAPNETRATRSDPLRTTTGQATNAELLARSGSVRRWRRTAPLAALGLAALAVIGWRLAQSTAAPALMPAPAAPLAAPAATPPAAPAAPGPPEREVGAPSAHERGAGAGTAAPAAAAAPPAAPATRAAAEPTVERSAPAARRKPARAGAPQARVPSQPPADLDLGI